MPLAKGSSQKTISGNIRELYAANADRPKPRPRKQIIAIAMRMAGKKRPAHVMSDHMMKKGM